MRPMHMKAGFEKELVRPEGGSARYLVVEVEAPEEERRRVERPNLNVALVIDRSGSMSGARLEAAKTAAEGVVRGLRDGDRLSLVAFDHESNVLLSGCAMSREGRAQALAAIQELQPGGMTNLAQGWFDGARSVAEGQASCPGAMNRVVVLSDGKANQGMVDPRELASHAGRLAAEGVLTSAVGIGDDYSPIQLQALADHGGGRLHDAATPEEMIEVVMMELGEMVSTVAERVVVRLEPPKGVQPVLLGSYAHENTSRGLVCEVGPLAGGARRRVVFQVEVPPGRVGSELVFSAEVSWTVPGEPEDRHGAFATARLRYASDAARVDQDVDRRLAEVAAETWKAVLTQQGVDFNQAGDVAGAVRNFQAAEGAYGRLCLDTDHASSLLRGLAQVRSMTGGFMATRMGMDLRDLAMADERDRATSEGAQRRRRSNAALRRLMEDKAKREAKKG